MNLTGLRKDALKLIIFGGKGGVGKTTCAASTGIYLSRYFKTLLFSTDPAHSLSDSLDQQIGEETTEVKGVDNLSALEVSSEKALLKFKGKYGDDIKKILDTATYLDQSDIDSVFSLQIPGIDEVMGFKTIVDLMEEGKYDKYILDTAPTGHALRLLTLPGLLDEWIKVVAKMRWKYRYMIQSFAGKYQPDKADDFLIEMKKTVKRIEGLLRDSEKCEFIAVTIPEAMAILETERLINTLNSYGIRVRQLVINNVMESGGCRFCRERKNGQEKHIEEIRRKFGGLKLTIVPLQPREVKGIESLHKFQHLFCEN